MKKTLRLFASTLLAVLSGCISADRKVRERLESERKDKESQEAIDKTYAGFINEYWDNYASASYKSALKGEYKDLSNFIYIAESDGMSVIEAFAEEKMPNTASVYEKAKERAMELQQVYNEDFPSPLDNSSNKYAIYCNLLDRLSKARTAYHRAYKELAHFYFQYKFGIINLNELTKVDEKPILIGIVTHESIPAWPTHKTLDGQESQFAAKYMPESYAIYQLFLKEYDELSRVYAEAQAERDKTNAFLDKAFEAAHHKGSDLAENVNKLTSEYVDLCMQHRMGDKDSEALAKIDHDCAEELKQFVSRLPTLMRDETFSAENALRLGAYLGFSPWDMILVPERNFKMQRTEVTQRQWKAIMGDNPSCFKGEDLPVENVSWNDVQKFIKRLNSIFLEHGINIHYRLPTEEEWLYCCWTGRKGHFLVINDPKGVCGWYAGNSGNKTHPVAQKTPNAWGIFDMHGNVSEWTSTGPEGGYRAHMGGDWNSYKQYREYHSSLMSPTCSRNNDLGFRLVVEGL